MIKLLENTLKFEQSDIDILNPNGIDPTEISIMYVSDDDKFPIISLSSNFGNDVKGSKINKSLSIIFKGQQNKFLSQFGNEFSLEVYEKNIFKMKSLSAPIVQDLEVAIVEIDLANEILDDTNYKIPNLQF